MAVLRNQGGKVKHYEEFSDDVIRSAQVAVQCYEAALADTKSQIPTPLHAAMVNLKKTLEQK